MNQQVLLITALVTIIALIVGFQTLQISSIKSEAGSGAIITKISKPAPAITSGLSGGGPVVSAPSTPTMVGGC